MPKTKEVHASVPNQEPKISMCTNPSAAVDKNEVDHAARATVAARARIRTAGALARDGRSSISPWTSPWAEAVVVIVVVQPRPDDLGLAPAGMLKTCVEKSDRRG